VRRTIVPVNLAPDLLMLVFYWQRQNQSYFPFSPAHPVNPQ
jgi:hypothetical protein